jgi:hypothetical protein
MYLSVLSAFAKRETLTGLNAIIIGSQHGSNDVRVYINMIVREDAGEGIRTPGLLRDRIAYPLGEDLKSCAVGQA